MIDTSVLFPAATDAMRHAFEAAPRSLLAVNAQIDYTTALQAHDPRYVRSFKARAEKFHRLFFKTLGYDLNTGDFQPQTPGKHVLFFGHVGCGKSTELIQLCEELRHPRRYWVLQVDLLELLDPSNVSYADVWLAVARQLVQQAKDEGIALEPLALGRLENWFREQVLTQESVREFSAEVKTEAESSVGLPFLAKVLARFSAAIRTGSTHRENLRTVVRNTYGEFVGALNQLLASLVHAVQLAGKGRDVLVVIDGTDRFRGDDWRRFFIEDANQLTMVSGVVVYTAPMALKSSGARLDGFDSLVLPMIKLHEFDDKHAERPEAYAMMRELLLKRCHASLFDSVESLDVLIDYSGGHLRDALRLLSYACLESESGQLTQAEITAAAKRLAGDYRDWLEAEHYAVLAAAERQPENAGRSEAITRLVEGGALLEYNTGSWRLPHPVLHLLPAFTNAVAKPAQSG